MRESLILSELCNLRQLPITGFGGFFVQQVGGPQLDGIGILGRLEHFNRDQIIRINRDIAVNHHFPRFVDSDNFRGRCRATRE